MKSYGLPVFVGMLGICGCMTPDTGTITPRLLFSISEETGLTAARDLTVDEAGNVYVFDYGDYVIRKFDPRGSQIVGFGGTGDAPGTFLHLMSIRASGDSLLALDAGSISVFDLSGQFRSRSVFADTIYSDLPRIHTDGRWIGEWIISESAEKSLTYRDSYGIEQARLASYTLEDLFPGIQPGEDFFINQTQAPTYLYDFDAEGCILWLRSDRLQLFLSQESDGLLRFESQATPIPFEEEEIRTLEQRQANIGPPFFLNVPHHYQLVHHLMVAGNGDVWLYVLSEERTGLLRLSPTGREKGFYEVDAEFDLLGARLTVANGELYFMSATREGTHIFNAPIP